MSVAVAPHNSVSHELELHVFELAYVFSLMRVESVAALPDAVLFPKDPRVRKKMLSEGEKRLIESGRLVLSESPGGAEYDDDLLSMAAAVADPSFTILARRQSPDVDADRSDVSIFFNPVEVVEVAHTEKQAFRFRRLPSPNNAFQRVRKMLDIAPTTRFDDTVVQTRIHQFEQVRKHAKAGEPVEAISLMQEWGMTVEAAEDFYRSLSKPKQKGVVTVLKHSEQKVTDVRVLGFQTTDECVWLTSVADESTSQVRAEAVGSERFVTRLVERVADVCRS